jgi:hypothetical protein
MQDEHLVDLEQLGSILRILFMRRFLSLYLDQDYILSLSNRGGHIF